MNLLIKKYPKAFYMYDDQVHWRERLIDENQDIINQHQLNVACVVMSDRKHTTVYLSGKERDIVQYKLLVDFTKIHEFRSVLHWKPRGYTRVHFLKARTNYINWDIV